MVRVRWFRVAISFWNIEFPRRRNGTDVPPRVMPEEKFGKRKVTENRPPSVARGWSSSAYCLDQ